MSLTRLVLRLLGACSHPHYRRERDKAGRLHFVCDDCERSWPAMSSTATDRKRTKALVARVARVRAEMARGNQEHEKVTQMRRRAK